MELENIDKMSRQLIADAQEYKAFEQFTNHASREELHLEFFKLYQRLPEKKLTTQSDIWNFINSPEENPEEFSAAFENFLSRGVERFRLGESILLKAKLSTLLEHPFFEGTKSFSEYIKEEYQRLMRVGINRSISNGLREINQPLYRLLDLDNLGNGIFDKNSCQRLESEALRNFIRVQLAMENYQTQESIRIGLDIMPENNQEIGILTGENLAIKLLRRWRADYSQKYSDEP